jgi:hypothetical protein
MGISKIREDALSDAFWDYHTNGLEERFPDKWWEDISAIAPMLKTLISDLKKIEIIASSDWFEIQNVVWREDFRSGPFHINRLSDGYNDPKLFRVICGFVVPHGCLILPGQEVIVQLSPWLIDTPFCAPLETFYGDVKLEPWDLDGAESSAPFRRPARQPYLEAIPYKFDYGVIPESDFLLDYGMEFIHSALGEAVLVNGYRELLSSLDDFIPLTNDLWQKYLDEVLACIERLESQMGK